MLASALKSKERSKENTFFQTKVVVEYLSIATETLCPDETYCGKLSEKQSASICRQVR